MARDRKQRPTGAERTNATGEVALSAAKSRERSSLREWVRSLATGFILFLILRTFLIQTFTITSGSMEGTLLVGDFLLLNKTAYGATVPGTDMRLPGYDSPERDDIVVFHGHHEPIDLVKRLVGMPGDTLSMKDGVLSVDGTAQLEPYVRHLDPGHDITHPWMVWQKNYLVDGVDPATYHPTRDNWGPLVVPPGNYFMMGDNRDDSLDSRYWGFVPEKDIEGRAVALYFSYDSDAIGPVPVLNHVRWNRIGEVLH